MKNISITMTEDIINYMKQRAKEESISLSAYVRRLVLTDMKDKQNGKNN